MNVPELIAKWRPSELRERQACHEHFLDLCELVGHPKPAADDPLGERFCFERGAAKLGGGDGWADVWKKGYFGWEYKGKHKDLAAAYMQLNLYREDLGNPPLLVVCDMERIEVHTNFTNTEARVHDLTFDALATPEGMRKLRAVFFDPDSLRPSREDRHVTEAVARPIGELAGALRGRGVEPHRAARFIDQLVFCMFAEDVGLLRKGLFTEILEKAHQEPNRLRPMLETLFATMAGGGFFGAEEVRRFNGNLFADAAVLDLLPNEIGLLDAAARENWSRVAPAIFGTLFERGLDPDKRAQIGAHYTSREDIETLVEPVVMAPLRREWEDVRATLVSVLTTGKKRPTGKEKPLSAAAARKAELEADTMARNFLDRIASVKVLDPACGSGNFLYVTLQKLMDLEREVLSFAEAHGIGGHFPRVDPRQLYGIEINAYAFELAQMTAWIGYLQWMSEHGSPWPADPVLKPLATFECKDAILDLSDPEHPKEPDWPAVDFIVSNPPFLGRSKLRSELGGPYLDALFSTYDGRIPKSADLCCYWFERARAQIAEGACERAGLLATQGIRGGASRVVLERIKATGKIFFALSDRAWILNGANVHVSMVGFDHGAESVVVLDGRPAEIINANLTTRTDVTAAQALDENRNLASRGSQKRGEFDLPEGDAFSFLGNSGNPNRRPNSDVLVPYWNGVDLVQRPRLVWVIDFGSVASLEWAAAYEGPFRYTCERVLPFRTINNDLRLRTRWWIHGVSQPAMRARVLSLGRFCVTARVAKHRVFAWLTAPVLPDDQLIVFASSEDHFFGVLQSRVHEVWARAQGTQVRERESGFRYTPTTCFETFPFPWPPGHEPADDPRVRAIGDAAHELNELRERWLNPPEWVREEVLEFPGSTDGPWARYVHDPDERGIGAVRWPRLVPRDAECAAKLKARTLTNLYNERPTWLALAHAKLDAAVFAAYAWDPAMTDEHLLGSLLALNLHRSDMAGDR